MDCGILLVNEMTVKMAERPRPETLLVNADAAEMDTIPKWGEVRFREENELVLAAKGFSDSGFSLGRTI